MAKRFLLGPIDPPGPVMEMTGRAVPEADDGTVVGFSDIALVARDLAGAPKDSRAWEQFVWRYRPMIYGWCREWGLQGADAEDVAQDVLARLTEKISQFQYDPSRCFRAWLKTVTQHAWSDSLADRLRGSDSRMLGRLETLEARADLKRRFEETFDRELMEMAIRKVQARVANATWEAFRLTALEGLSGAEASQKLSASVASVFVSKHRVQKLLKEEIQRLEAAQGE